ncbi:DUF3348 family protein [Spongiibacter marinus]|uniref:DUF3348 family protein n=1 Tax=Spongiibacter marinus TaxID=354246 RepID=UPI003C5FF02A
MPKAAAHAPPTPSRLAHTLNALGVAASAAPRAGFADKLAELIDLSGAIALSELLRGLRRVKATGEAAGDDAQALFMARRADMIEAISASFTLDPEAMASSPAGFILPSPNADTFGSDAAGYAPYQRFYALHQSEIDHRVISLRGELRKLLAGRSEALAQLAALDTMMEGTLAVYSRRALSALPKLLAQHFFALRSEQQNIDADTEQPTTSEQWLADGGWLWQFHTDMQSLLLAELALRLQPLQGLLEALNSEHEDTP